MIEYDVSEDGLRINVFPRGILDVKDTVEYFQRLSSDTNIKQGAVEFVNFNNVTDFKISYAESKEITESYQEAKNKRLIQKTVFVCETDLAYGIGRMLQTIHEITNPDHQVVVTRSQSEVEDMLVQD